MSLSEQDKIIGKHPIPPCVFQQWLNYTDHPVTPTKKHRSLIEVNAERKKFIEQLSVWIIKHHITEHKINRLQRKLELLGKYGYEKYLATQNLLPTDDNTRKGNATEIILCEYLKSSSTLDLLFYKLRFNGNVNQAMKGDDVLLLDKKRIYDKVILGEAKYRAIPTKEVINEISQNLESDKLPLSLTQIETYLDVIGEHKLAEKVSDLLASMHNAKFNIISSGLLLSTKSDTHKGKDTRSQVEKHLSSSNPNLVFLSLGIENPEQIIDEAFHNANEILKGIEKIPTELKPAFWVKLSCLLSLASINDLVNSFLKSKKNEGK
jgi:hypothetical protein